MSDYTELVKALRYCVSGVCKNCSYFEKCKKNGTPMAQLHNDAAAAIEELQADNKEMLHELEDAAKQIRELQDEVLSYASDSQPHWVSVEERLPNVDEKVLVFAIGKLDGFIGDTVIALTSMSDTNWLNHHEKVDKPYWLDPWQYFLTDYRITHWMPLPEPPQEG